MGRQGDIEIAYSVNGVPIRLTYERWFHITENHDDLASYYFEVLETVEKPGFIGNKGRSYLLTLCFWHGLQARRAVVGGQRSEIRCQMSEVGGRRSDVRCRRSEVGDRRSDVTEKAKKIDN